MPAAGQVTKIYARVSECPDLFGISRSSLYRLKDQGLVKMYKISGITVVKVSEMMEFIESHPA